jgi:hypothetical protein
MKDLHPDWFTIPLRGKDVMNIALEPVRLRLVRFEGSYAIIRSIDEALTLADRDHEQLTEITERYFKAAIELGEELKSHRDFKLI